MPTYPQTYLGEYRSKNIEGQPSSGILIHGWIERKTDLSSTSCWVLQLDANDQLFVAADHYDYLFLETCHKCQLSVWATGRLYPSPLKLFVPVKMNVYTNGQAGNRQEVTVSLAEMLYESAVSYVTRELFLTPKPLMLEASTLVPSLCSPDAYFSFRERMEELALLPNEISGAVMFLMNQASCAKRKMKKFHGSDSVRLGGTSFTFSRQIRGGNRVYRNREPRALTGETVRGSLVVAQSAKVLHMLIRELFKIAPQGPTLFLARREALPFLQKALSDSGEPFLGIYKARDFAQEALPTANIVVMAVETLLHPDAETNCWTKVSPRLWERFVLVGWPDVQDDLRTFGLHVGYTSKISLCLADELQAEALDMEDVEAMLGVSPCSMQDPLASFPLLQSCIYYLRDEGLSVPEPCTLYQLVRGPEISEMEELHLEGLRGSQRGEMCLFSGVCRDAVRCTFLGAQKDPVEHFQCLGLEMTPFAQTQLRSCRESAWRQQECPVCFEEGPDIVTSCGHFFCSQCLNRIFRARTRCPTCREGISTRNLISLLPMQRGRPGVYQQHLLDFLLARADAKTVVLASWPQHHEKFTAELRREGLENCWAWRGNVCRMLQVHAEFSRKGTGGCLFVDPSLLEWEYFEDVKEIVVLWPLNREEPQLDGCCQMRRAKQAFPNARFTLILRGEQEEAPGVAVTCRSRGLWNACRCSPFVSLEALAQRNAPL